MHNRYELGNALSVVSTCVGVHSSLGYLRKSHRQMILLKLYSMGEDLSQKIETSNYSDTVRPTACIIVMGKVSLAPGMKSNNDYLRSKLQV